MPSSNTTAINFIRTEIIEDNFQIPGPGGLYSESLIMGGIIFCVSDLVGFYTEGLIFGILQHLTKPSKLTQK